MSDNIFARIARGDVPVEKVYEDEWVVAIRDIQPAAPVHVLVLPRKALTNAAALEPEDQSLAGAVLLACAEVARRTGIDKTGYRIVLNAGDDAGQTVPHLHAHVLGGGPLGGLCS